MTIPSERLKLTIWPGQEEQAGLLLDLDSEVRTQAHWVLNGLSALQSNLLQIDKLKEVFQILQMKVVDQLFSLQQIPQTLTKALTLHGPNQSHLPCETFQQFEPKLCSSDLFRQRTQLKIKRTLENITQFLKAYPDEEPLRELESSLRYFKLDDSAQALDQTIRQLTQLPEFLRYLELKDQFLEDWKELQTKEQGTINTRLFSTPELSQIMKVLQNQKGKIEKKPEVLRYKKPQFFRSFNRVTHGEVNSISMGFWKIEKNRDQFLRFITATRKAFSEQAPFSVFRFENSFTYLLCGFPDEQLLGSLEQNQDMVPVHAKILLRQSNQSYRELTAEDGHDLTLYYNCLKEAMYPFILYLNQRVQMNLSDDFINFFRI